MRNGRLRTARTAAAVACLAGAAGGVRAQGSDGQCDPRWIPSWGFNGQVHVMQVWDSIALPDPRVIVGGLFTRAEAITANRIASWDGAAWTPLSTGMERVVYSLAPFRGEMVAGGWFLFAGGTFVNHIASWNGEAWTPLFDGTGCCVRALLEHNGDLYAGGSFPNAGRLTVNSVARWDGSTWHRLGDGLGGGFPTSTAYALAAFREVVVIGGNFTTAGGIAANGVALWDGSRWQTLGEGVNGSVYALREHRGDLIAGGDFTLAGGEPANSLARWDGEQWHELGGGTSGQVLALGTHSGDLVVGGMFRFAGGNEVNSVALWNGEMWRALGAGVDGPVTALVEFGPELLVGGAFATAGGQNSPNWARWAAGGAPWIAGQPRSREVPPLDTVEFAVAVPTGYEPLDYQWRRDGTPVIDGVGGASPGGGEIVGSATPTLTIIGVRTSDGGGFDCVVTNPCGQVTSRAGSLTFSCYADCDTSTGVGGLDIFDFLCFQNRFAGADPYACDCDTGTGRGVCDVFDFLCYQNAFAAGCK